MALGDEWLELSEAWRSAVADDPVFLTDIAPLVRRHVGRVAGRWLDLGCGEGRAMRLVPDVVGCDISSDLLSDARRHGPVVRCRLPDLSWLREGALDGAFAVLVVEHLADLDRFFVETVRVVREGGSLVVVANHPAFTAEGSGPIVDLTDGEVLWRWGPYFVEAASTVTLGGTPTTVHHRTIGAIATAAGRAGWTLEEMEERALGPAAIEAIRGYEGQDQLPRLIAVRWRR
jgi:SAM-dependent methyltransferase